MAKRKSTKGQTTSFMDQSSPLSEMIRLCSCFPREFQALYTQTEEFPRNANFKDQRMKQQYEISNTQLTHNPPSSLKITFCDVFGKRTYQKKELHSAARLNGIYMQKIYCQVFTNT